MNIYRWILFPLLSAILLSISLTVCLLAIGFPLMKFIILLGFIVGGLMGFVLQFYNEYRTRKILPEASENDFEVNQTKRFALLYGYDETFDLCLEFVEQYPKTKLKNSDRSEGIIEAKTKMGWNSNGNNVSLNIKKITENTTEVEILTTPKMPASLADCGEGLKIIEELNDFFQTEGDKKRLCMLEEKTEIPIDFYSGHTGKVKFEES